jgi:hypothetical protein
MKYFVLHHPKLKQRREHVEKRLSDFGICNVEWVEHLNSDSDFVIWLKEWSKSQLQCGHISCTVKYYWIFKKMIEQDIQEVIILEDDVVFSDLFKNFIVPQHTGYIKLGKGVNWSVPVGSKPIIVHNYGGTEAQYVSINFAKEMMDIFTLEQTLDIVIWAHMLHTRQPTLCIPVCHQTSLLEGSGITGTNTDNVMPWKTFIMNWKNLHKTSWNFVLNEYEKKKKAEEDFERVFHKKISIINCDYIKEYAFPE